MRGRDDMRREWAQQLLAFKLEINSRNTTSSCHMHAPGIRHISLIANVRRDGTLCNRFRTSVASEKEWTLYW